MSTEADPAGSDRRAQAVERRAERATTGDLRRTVKLGLKSGLVATVVMTTFRMPISRSPPPTADFWATYVAGGDPEDHTAVGLVLHLAYGIGAGVVFAVLSPSRTTGSEVEDESRGILRGLAYGILLSTFGVRFVLEGLLGMDLEPDERFIFHVSHVVYGLTLGAWHGSTVD